MILPEKHIKIAESLIGVGAFIINLLSQPQTIEKLWISFEGINNTSELPANHSYDNFFLAVMYLFTIGTIDTNEKGELYAIN